MEETRELIEETEWSRTYANPTGTGRWFESKFVDKTASISIESLMKSWPTWTEHEKVNFCQAYRLGRTKRSDAIIRVNLGTPIDELWPAYQLLATHPFGPIRGWTRSMLSEFFRQPAIQVDDSESLGRPKGLPPRKG